MPSAQNVYLKRVATCYLAMAMLVVPILGCSSVPLSERTGALATGTLPSPEINPDLIKSLEPSNDRDWIPSRPAWPRPSSTATG